MVCLILAKPAFTSAIRSESRRSLWDVSSIARCRTYSAARAVSLFSVSTAARASSILLLRRRNFPEKICLRQTLLLCSPGQHLFAILDQLARISHFSRLASLVQASHSLRVQSSDLNLAVLSTCNACVIRQFGHEPYFRFQAILLML